VAELKLDAYARDFTPFEGFERSTADLPWPN
jgi:hypothetical protein